MRLKLLIWLLLLSLLGVNTAFSATDKFILLPNQDGTTGAIQVTSPTGTKLIRKPYSMVKVNEKGEFVTVKANVLCVENEFERVLDTLPKSTKYEVGLDGNGGALDSKSKAIFDSILAQISSTTMPFVVLTGHSADVEVIKALLLKTKIKGLTILLDIVPDSEVTDNKIKVAVQ